MCSTARLRERAGKVQPSGAGELEITELLNSYRRTGF